MTLNVKKIIKGFPLILKRFLKKEARYIYLMLKSVAKLLRKKEDLNACPDLRFKYSKARLYKCSLGSVDLKASERKLYFIDRENDSKVFCFANKVIKNKNVYLLFKTKIDYQKFKDQLIVEDCVDRVFFVPGIDYDIDDDVYAIAHDFAVELLEAAKESFTVSGFPSSFAESITSLNLGVTDRLQAWIRNALFLKKLIMLHGVEKFYFLSTAGSQLDLIALFVQEQLGIPAQIITTSDQTGVFNARSLIGNNWNLPAKSIVSRYPIDHSLLGNGGFIFYFGNLKDPLYRGTADAVLRDLSKTTELEVVVLQSDAAEAHLGSPGTIFLKPSIEPFQGDGLSDFMRSFDFSCTKFIANNSNDFDSGILRIYSLANSRRTLYKLMLDCFVLKNDLDEILARDNVKALVSNPGRLWMSQFINRYLKDTPSFEIQSGTLSRTLRYRPPHSRYILAVDDFSKEVYCEFLGVDESRVNVVGAPRIDDKLSEIREVPSQKSRKHMSFPSEGELTCIATQPYGVELMARMVKEVTNILETDSEHFLVVSMHPNETSEYEAAYRQVLGSFLTSGQAVISRGEIYHCMNASDNVVTFFSTSGIEAFCLKKRVFSFRPSDLDSVPFDLCKLGVALPFSDSRELREHLDSDIAARPSTVGLRNLQDGKSVSRICSFIAEHI